MIDFNKPTNPDSVGVDTDPYDTIKESKMGIPEDTDEVPTPSLHSQDETFKNKMNIIRHEADDKKLKIISEFLEGTRNVEYLKITKNSRGMNWEFKILSLDIEEAKKVHAKMEEAFGMGDFSQ